MYDFTFLKDENLGFCFEKKKNYNSFWAPSMSWLFSIEENEKLDINILIKV